MQRTSFFSLTMEFNALIVMKYGIMTSFSTHLLFPLQI